MPRRHQDLERRRWPATTQLDRGTAHEYRIYEIGGDQVRPLVSMTPHPRGSPRSKQPTKNEQEKQAMISDICSADRRFNFRAHVLRPTALAALSAAGISPCAFAQAPAASPQATAPQQAPA